MYYYYYIALFEAPGTVVQALQECHQASVQAPQHVSGKVKVHGRKTWQIPVGVMQIIAATCSEHYSDTTVLFEPLDSALPAGLLASPALV